MHMRAVMLVFLLFGGCAGGGSRPDGPADAASAATDAAADAAHVLDAEVGPAETAADSPTCTQSCNSATPRDPTVDPNGGSGNVTMYTTEPSAGGACNYGTTAVRSFAAINVNLAPGDGQGQWQGGRICGQCALVTAFTSQGPRSVVVRIMDRCADASCGIDLGGLAPAAIMLDGFGRYDGAWRFVSCAGHPEVSDGPPSLFVSLGSNAWWSRLQVRNPPWPVAEIAWQAASGAAGGKMAFAADPENTFAVPTEVLQSSAPTLLVTVTYTDGSTATARLAPSQLAAAGGAYALAPG
jgi:expansin (peptidoglycan-binding protein)